MHRESSKSAPKRQRKSQGRYRKKSSQESSRHATPVARKRSESDADETHSVSYNDFPLHITSQPTCLARDILRPTCVHICSNAVHLLLRTCIRMYHRSTYRCTESGSALLFLLLLLSLCTMKRKTTFSPTCFSLYLSVVYIYIDRHTRRPVVRELQRSCADSRANPADLKPSAFEFANVCALDLLRGGGFGMVWGNPKRESAHGVRTVSVWCGR